MDYKLKNCPFCGGKAEIKYVQSGWSYENTAYVKCNNCKATGGVIEDHNCGNHFKEAIDKWNHRV